jgi:uncharacterized protein YprB with RNaseH-like and TPR domain
MSGLRDRIQRLKGASSANAEPKTVAAEEREEALPSYSRVIDTDEGRFIMRERKFPYRYEHGLYRLGELDGMHTRLTRISKRFEALRSVESHHDLLFFDTETSGLGVGAGNVPFMLGVGFFTDDEFIVQQLFVRNPGEEYAMLSYFATLSARFTHLVTYNGRSFDWPVVQNRYVINRLPFDHARLEQLDLLYISRNLWKHSLESCRLSKVEEERLGITRHDDVPGSLAPMLYFQYLADKKIEPMEGVFQHNELDVLTLSTLTAHLGAILSGSIDWSRLVNEDLFRIGVWLTESDLVELGERAFQELLSRPAEEIVKYYAPLAMVYKKQRRYEEAVGLWEQAVAYSAAAGAVRGATLQSMQPLIELAMYHEHHSKEFSEALRYTEAAMDRLDRRLSLHKGTAKDRELKGELAHRRSRLLSKLNRRDPQEDDRQLSIPL